MKKTVSLVVVMLCVCTTAMAINVNRDIPFAATSPTIDGVIGAGEWGDALSWDVVYDDNLSDGGQLIGEPPTDAADSSYTVSMKWDETNLYIAGVVADDVILWDTNPADGMNDGDLLQFCLALDGHTGTFLGDMALYDFAVNVNSSAFEVYSHSWPALAFNNAQIGGVQSTTGYTMELAMPWSDLDGYAPVVGDVHFSGFLTGDRDVVGGGMTNLFDFGQTTGGWGALVDANQWNTISLVPEPATIFLVGLGCLGCLALRKRKV